MERITEVSATIQAKPKEIVDKKMPVFYNPVMKMNRDISILLLSAFSKLRAESSVQSDSPLRIADPLAGSGIRSIRMIKELPSDMIKEMSVNDKKENYKEYLETNLELSKLSDEQKAKIKIFNEDANTFLFENRPFDYIDIDPFGTPNPFLDSAIRSLRSEGILAVTATDTSALCGSYPKACQRKYWAKPLRNELMHEIGIRILIRKVQLMGTNHQRALVPILSYSMDHYMRVFFRFDKGKKNMDKVLSQHEPYCVQDPATQNAETFGPIWTGQLNDLDLLKKINLDDADKKTAKLIETLIEESHIPGIGFIDLHKEAKGKPGSLPKITDVMQKLKEKGFKVSRTHFCDTAIKTDAEKEEITKPLENQY